MERHRALTRLLLARHGETQWNLEHRMQGHRDSPLTDRGRWQAKQLAERLRSAPLAAIYSSDLGRTQATAALLAAPHGLEVRSAPAFREGHFGLYEGATHDELVARYGPAVDEWLADPVDQSAPGGETLRQLHQRVAAFIRQVVADHPGQTLLLVGHGGSVRAAVMETVGADLGRWRSLRLDNASLCTIDSNGRDSWLISFNDTAHLQAGAAEPSA